MCLEATRSSRHVRTSARKERQCRRFWVRCFGAHSRPESRVLSHWVALVGLGGASIRRKRRPIARSASERRERSLSSRSTTPAKTWTLFRRSQYVEELAPPTMCLFYGECVVLADSGCGLRPCGRGSGWPACKRHVALHDSSLPGHQVPPLRRSVVHRQHSSTPGFRWRFLRGSHSSSFSGTHKLESPIANALSGLNVGVPTDREFPARAIGAVEGKLRC